MTRWILIGLVGLLSGGLYLGLSQRARVAEACFAWPEEPDLTIAACEKVLAREDLSPRIRGLAHYQTGLALHMDKDWVGAIAAYDAAEALRPDHDMIPHNRAKLHMQTGAYDKALADARRAQDLHGEARDDIYYKTLFLAARAEAKLKQPEAALATLSDILDARPDQLRARKLRLSLTEEGGPQPETALTRLRDLTALIESERESSDYLARRVDVFSRLQLSLLAASDAHARMTDLVSETDDGAALAKMTESALNGIKDALAGQIDVACGDTDAACLEGRITALWRAGHLEEAMAEVDRMLAHDPYLTGYREVRAVLGQILATLQDLDIETPVL